MEKSTEDQLPTYKQMTFEDSRNAIFLPGSEDGRSPCNSQDGARIVPSGRDLVPVSRSAKRASKKGKTTNGISGRRCSGSSASVSLSQCLVSRLRQQLDTDGSTEYRTTWREKITPLGRSYWEHSASAHRIKEADYTGWPTPQACEGPNMSTTRENGRQAARITPQTVVGLVGWPTPAACETTGAETVESKRARGSGGINLQQAATLTPWVSPTATDGGRGSLPARATDTGIPLSQQVALTPWGTPASRDWKDGHQADVQTNSLLGRQAWLSTASTENRGVLDAAFSRWLMGFPESWDEASPNFQDWQSVQELIALGV